MPDEDESDHGIAPDVCRVVPPALDGCTCMSDYSWETCPVHDKEEEDDVGCACCFNPEPSGPDSLLSQILFAVLGSVAAMGVGFLIAKFTS